MWHILLDVASINTEEILILFSSVCNIPLIRLGLDESVIHFAICPTAVKFPTDSHIFLQHLMEELDALPARLGCRDFRLLTEPTNLNRANKSAAKKHIMNKACPGAGHVVCCVLLLFFFCLLSSSSSSSSSSFLSLLLMLSSLSWEYGSQKLILYNIFPVSPWQIIDDNCWLSLLVLCWLTLIFKSHDSLIPVSVCCNWPVY